MIITSKELRLFTGVTKESSDEDRQQLRSCLSTSRRRVAAGRSVVERARAKRLRGTDPTRCACVIIWRDDVTRSRVHLASTLTPTCLRRHHQYTLRFKICVYRKL
ncbi:hypothetical protein J6590_044754 [Homalodisca vitripennis]|nr:hypothetical protein J6590_044754 [Homalodisca vitripennis]